MRKKEDFYKVIDLNEKYAIRTEPCCLVLSEKKINKKNGEKYYENIGYYGKVEHILKAIVEKEIKADLDLLKNMEEIAKMIKEIEVNAKKGMDDINE